jgi:hypothetical protein
MEQSPSWEANRCSASQEIPCILWKPKFHLRIQKYPPPVPILRQINAFHALHPTYWRSILILSSHVSLGLPGCLFPSGFHTNTLYTPLLSPYVLHASPNHSRFYHPNNIGWEVQIIKLLVYGFLHSPVTSSHLGPVFFSAPYSQTPSYVSP